MTYLPSEQPFSDPDDSKIRSLLKGSMALHSPPPNGRQLLIKKVLLSDYRPKKAFAWLPNLFEFPKLPNGYSESLAVSEIFVLSNARVFGLPGTGSLHLIL